MTKLTAILIAVILSLAVNVFAVAQFSAIAQNQGVGIQLNSSGSLYLYSDMTLPSNFDAFGYYKMDRANNMLTSTTLDLKQIESLGGLIGSFSAGDRIAFWVQTTEGAYLDSMNRDGRKGNARYAAYYGNNGLNNTSAIIGTGGYGSGYSPYKGQPAKSDFVFEIGNVAYEIPVTGQPLPGVVLSLAAGLAVLLILQKKRKRMAV